MAISVSPGIQPLTIQPPWQSGRYYMTPSFVSTGTSATLVNGTLRGLPVYIPNNVTLSRIGAEITSAGDAGSKLRLGIYADDGTGRPGTLVLDAGTIAGDSVAVQEIVISQALGSGLYWFVGAVQLVTVTQPTVRTANPQGVILADYGTVTPAAASVLSSVSVAGVTGALPTAFGVSSLANLAPRIFTKVA